MSRAASLRSYLTRPISRYFLVAGFTSPAAVGAFDLTALVIVSSLSPTGGALGLLVVLSMLPSLILAPFCGALLDRHNKVLIAGIAGVVRTLILLLLGTLLIVHALSLSGFYIVISAYYLCWYLSASIADSIVKEIFTDTEYQDVVSITQGLHQAGLIVAVMVCGFVMKFCGTAAAVFLSAIFVIAAVASFWRMHVLGPRRAVPQDGPQRGAGAYASDVADGFRYVFSTRAVLYTTAVAATVLPFYQILNVLIAPYTFRVLHGDAATLGLLDSAAGIGSLVSAIYCLWRSGRTRWSPASLVPSLLLLALATVLLSRTSFYVAAFGTYVVIGFMLGNLRVISKALVYRNTAAAYAGRVMTALSSFSLALAIGAAAAAGAFVDGGIPRAYLALAMFALVPLALALARMLDERRQPAPTPGKAYMGSQQS